jgi:hypothetical protein
MKMNSVKKLVLVTSLAIVAMAFLPADSVAGVKICAVQYYHDAAHTQWAGYCGHHCDPNYYPFCTGEQTQYSELVECMSPEAACY